jgi:hypothetical protein
MDYTKLCTPAFIYFIVSLTYVLVDNLTNFNITNIIINLFMIIFWSLILNFICRSGFTVVSWILLFIPLLVYFTDLISYIA